MKLTIILDTKKEPEERQKPRRVLVEAWSIIKGVRKTYGHKALAEHCNMISGQAIEVAS